LLIGVLGLLAGCATHPVVGGAPGLQVVQSAVLPGPVPEDLASSTVPYYVGPFDKLTIDVFGIAELSQREVMVNSQGEISFPIAGAVQVAGKTPAEIEEVLADRLRLAHVRDPQVTVNVKEMLSQRLTVEGEVRTPGVYPMAGRMTLLRAIAQAQGTTEYTRLNDVVIFRTVKGQGYAALYDLGAIRRGAYEDPEVFAGDLITVGESRGRRLFKDFLQTLPVLTGPLVIALDRVGK
jgi:polysaccharide export outer membrane protein